MAVGLLAIPAHERAEILAAVAEPHYILDFHFEVVVALELEVDLLDDLPCVVGAHARESSDGKDASVRWLR